MRAPAPHFSGLGSMGCPNFSVAPHFRQLRQEAVEALPLRPVSRISLAQRRERRLSLPNSVLWTQRDGEKAGAGVRNFLAQFKNVLVILLLIATAISAALWLIERESPLPYEAMAIFAVVLLNAIIGFVQGARAESAVDALRRMSTARANVIRDGERENVAGSEIVPGDLILIEEGDTIPADARLVRSTALQAAEAALTGESLPVTKDIAPIAGDAGIGDRLNVVFSGAAATYGRGQRENDR
jgi:Ca2+-transporting ATPase